MNIQHRRKSITATSLKRSIKSTGSDLVVYGENKLTEHDYHSLPYLSSHAVKDFANQDLSDYYLWRKHIKRDIEFAQTPALAMGSAIHTVLLEPKYFNQRFTVKPENINRRTKIGREEYEQFLADNAKKTILTQEQYDTAMKYKKGYNNPAAKQLLKGMAKEVSGFRVIDGVLFKGRADAVNWQQKFGADVKTVVDISPREFSRAVAKYRYDLQQYTYTKLFDLKDFAFICYTKEHPLECVIYQLNDEWMLKAEDDFNSAIQRFKRVTEASEHHSFCDPSSPVITIAPPTWFLKG